MFLKAKSDFDKIVNDLFSCKMRVDILDNPESFVLTAELPGIKKEEIDLEYAENILTLSVNKESEPTNDTYLKKERRYTFQERSFDIPMVDFSHCKASLDMGILTVVLPKVKIEGQKIDIE